MKKTFFLLLTVFLPLLSWGQDSLKTLTLPQLFLLTVKNNPVAKQASLLSDQARAEVRFARGGFDPKIVADFARKEFKGKDYYSDFYGYLSVPTWVGVDFKAGWERSAGKFVAPEGSTPINGLSFIGATAAIGNGMFIDQRRANLRQAQYLKNINEAERVKAINKLLLNAAKDYMDWYFHYQEYQYAKTGLEFADLRFRGTRERVLIGEQAGIDSVEAKILLQDRMIALQQAEVNYRNARLGLSVYLWDDNGNPLEISEKLIPELPASATEPAFGQLLTFAENNHPEIQKLVYKGFQLEIDRRLAVEGFKPKLDISYNLIDNTPLKAENLNGNFGRNNYKLGVDFSLPLLYRKERGKLALTKIKIEQNQLERLNTNREIVNNLKATYNSLLTNRSLLNMQAEMVRNYQTLRNAEIDKFDIGESSLFLVNTRESKLLEGQVKQADLERKYHKAIIELQWAAGVSDWWGR